MKFDLIFSVILTFAAAITVATTVVTLGENVRSRLRLATALASWFVVVALLAVTNALSGHPAGVAGLGAAVLVPIAIIVLTTVRSASAQRALLGTPLSWIVGVNVLRVLGVGFLLLHSDGRLSAPFATVAGWGDILVGLTALPVAWLIHTTGWNARIPLVMWNSLGLLDLVAAVGLGTVSAPGPLQLISTPPGSALMTTLPWLLIPGFLVPLLAASHLAIFYRLRLARSSRRNVMQPQGSTLGVAGG